MVFISGGHQTGLPQHLQDHGLCRLLQMSTVGETAGKSGNLDAFTTVILIMFSMIFVGKDEIML